MPRNPGEPDPQTWESSKNFVLLDTARRRRDGKIDRRRGNSKTYVVKVLLAGPAGVKLARFIADACSQAGAPAALLAEFRRAHGLPLERCPKCNATLSRLPS